MFAPIPSDNMNDEATLASEKRHHEVVRRMHTDEEPLTNVPILIMDSAADISCIERGFEILFHTGQTTTVGGTMAEMESMTYDIVTGATVIESPLSTQSYLVIINQAAYIPNEQQYESLLHCDQARYHNVIVNDLSKYFQDSKGSNIRMPTPSDWDQLPIIELTSPIPWQEHNAQVQRMREKPISPLILQEWSERLGHLNLKATENTLKATTQLISSVEAETRATPRRHMKSRLPALRPKRLAEGFQSDTFFASERSMRGNTCAQIFVGESSGYTVILPLKHKGQAHLALQDFIRHTGAPAFIMVDGAPEENKGKWLSICRTYCISQHTSEPGYQNQNKAERRIGDIKR